MYQGPQGPYTAPVQYSPLTPYNHLQPPMYHHQFTAMNLSPLKELDIPTFNGKSSDFENWYTTTEAIMGEPAWQGILLHQATTPWNAALSRSLWARLQIACASDAKNRLLYNGNLEERGIGWLAALHASYNPALPEPAAYALLSTLTAQQRKPQ